MPNDKPEIYEPPEVPEMVEGFLKQNGYDGLFQSGECACLIGDIAPCGEIHPDCKAGYKSDCRGFITEEEEDAGEEGCHLDGDCGFHVGERKPGK